jgi:hypothetical protein
MATTHLRLALDACVLSAVLVVGSAGGAIAAADPEAGDSTSGGQSAEGSTQGVSSEAPQVASTAETGASESPTKSRQVDPARPARTMILDVTTIIEKHLAAVTKQLKEGAGATAAVAAGGTPDGGTPDPDVGGSQQTAVAPTTPAVTSESSAVAPVANPLVALGAVVPKGVVAVAPAVQAITSIPGVVVSLPTSPTPVTDVITAIQDTLTSVVVSGIAIAQVPSDIAAMMGFPSTIAPGAIGGTLSATRLSGAIDEPMPASAAEPPPEIAPTSGYWGVPSAGNTDEKSPLGSYSTTSMRQEISPAAVATVAPEGIAPPAVLSFLEHTVSAVLVPASLLALAALALPGVGGLLIISAAGALVGYRQAKAASSLRAAGIARFAQLGPLGVVRSGSLVALHPRKPRGVRRQESRASPLKTVA